MTAIIIFLIACFLVFWYWMIKERETIKLNYHVDNNSMRHRADFPSGERQEEELNRAERKAHALLQETNSGSLWGEVIRNTISKRSSTEFRKLIAQLKDQAKDSPDVMIKIIGREAYDAVMVL